MMITKEENRNESFTPITFPLQIRYIPVSNKPCINKNLEIQVQSKRKLDHLSDSAA